METTQDDTAAAAAPAEAGSSSTPLERPPEAEEKPATKTTGVRVAFDATDVMKEAHIDPKTGNFSGDMDLSFIDPRYSPNELEATYKFHFFALQTYAKLSVGGDEAALYNVVEYFISQLPSLKQELLQNRVAHRGEDRHVRAAQPE